MSPPVQKMESAVCINSDEPDIEKGVDTPTPSVKASNEADLPLRKAPDWFGTREQVHHAKQHVQATLGLFGNVIIWCGAWNLLTERRRDGFEDDDAPMEIFAHEERTIIYLIVGWLLTLWSDSITFSAGVWSNIFSPKLWGHRTRFAFPLQCLRWFVSMWGQIMFWVGIIDFFDFMVVEVSTERDIAYLVFGLAGVIGTNTHEHMSYCYSDVESNREVVSHESSVKARILEVVRCTVAVFAQSLVWLACWNLTLASTTDLTMAYAQCIFGIACMLVARTYVASAWVVPEIVEPWDEVPSPRNFLHYCRVLFAMTGYLAFWDGAYLITYVTMGESITVWRNVVAMIVGCIMTMLAGTFWVNQITVYDDDGDFEEPGDEHNDDEHSPVDDNTLKTERVRHFHNNNHQVEIEDTFKEISETFAAISEAEDYIVPVEME